MIARREIIVLALLFIALVVFVVLGPAQVRDQNRSETPTSYSSAPQGALGLFRWVKELGYDAQRLEYREYHLLEENADALVILGPSETMSPESVDEVLDWVDLGGTLILADDEPPQQSMAATLFRKLNITQSKIDNGTNGDLVLPVFDNPPVAHVHMDAVYGLKTNKPESVPLVITGTDTLVVGQPYGDGYIIVSAGLYPFTNKGLRGTNESSFVANLLRYVPEGGQVLFDEYHHGFVETPSLIGLLQSSAFGWGILLACIFSVLYLILTGRRFGVAIPLREEVVLRSSAEYVESLADLFRRGNKRAYVLQHYYSAFRRRIARSYGIPTDLPDTNFVNELERLRPVNRVELLGLLAQLRNEKASEEELLRAVRAADALLDEWQISKS